MSNIVPVDFLDVSRLAATLTLDHMVEFELDTRRQTEPKSPHHDTRCICLRGPHDASPANWQHDIEHVDQPALDAWPTARASITQIAESHYARAGVVPHFGKIMVVGLRSGGHVDWHTDQGSYAEQHDRFHLPLLTAPGAFLFSGPMGFSPVQGQLVWFNNRVLHSAVNFSPIERVHMIVDIRKPQSVQ